MRHGVQQRRSRGGRVNNRRPGNNGNRSYDSNGPDVRIRGTANQIFEKYLVLARDAGSAGDRVLAENYLQHAEHYFRLMTANGGPRPQQTDEDGNQQGDGEDGGQQPIVQPAAFGAEQGELEMAADPQAA